MNPVAQNSQAVSPPRAVIPTEDCSHLLDTVTLLLYNTVMKPSGAKLWTIDELREQVAAALAVGYEGVPSGRVRDVPDLRTIRYYTTLGLLDRPAEMRGRTAFYGQRHLRQLVAIKKLQAAGNSLSEIQARVIGRSNTALETSTTGRERNFWREPPVEVAPAPVNAGTEQAVELGSDVTLSFRSQRPIDDEDLRVIHLAAAPLVEFLRLRGLVPNETGGDR